jgi:hypothetical protein
MPIPEISFIIPNNETVGGKLYLGAFIAFLLFLSFILGNLYFFFIILVCSVFIFLSISDKDSDERSFLLDESGIHIQNTLYSFDSLQNFCMLENVFGDSVNYLRLTFKSPLEIDLFIELPVERADGEDLDIIKFKKILGSKVIEKNKDLTFIDALTLRFFS